MLLLHKVSGLLGVLSREVKGMDDRRSEGTNIEENEGKAREQRCMEREGREEEGREKTGREESG